MLIIKEMAVILTTELEPGVTTGRAIDAREVAVCVGFTGARLEENSVQT